LAKKSIIAKAQREPKFGVRKYNRCPLCGRPRGVLADSSGNMVFVESASGNSHPVEK